MTVNIPSLHLPTPHMRFIMLLTGSPFTLQSFDEGLKSFRYHLK